LDNRPSEPNSRSGELAGREVGVRGRAGDAGSDGKPRREGGDGGPKGITPGRGQAQRPLA